ncbi:MAG: hypothetical protein EXS05_10855 [Planctomycetaceae bacterium]|nr:hypothetical protein [Planctomycetaceae bacterium]
MPTASRRFDWRSGLLSQGLLLAVLCAPHSLSGADDPARIRASGVAVAADGNGTREFLFHVKTTTGEPVSGAKVTPWAVLYEGGGFGLDEKQFTEIFSDADGTVRVVFPDDDALAQPGADSRSRLLRDALRHGLKEIAMRVDHPDHPQWSNYLPVEGGPIQLVDSGTIIVRARQGTDDKLIRGIYPVIGPSLWSANDCSEADGVLTIGQVDLTSAQASRWLRILHVPEKGSVPFSDLIDLTQQANSPIALNLTLKPGVRFVGRLSGDIPRPVRQGRVVARIVTGRDAWTNWHWSATADVADDGKFVLDSLPPDEHLQLIALCDGWVSTSPTKEEDDAYASENGFTIPDFHSVAGHVRPRLFRINDRPVVRSVPLERTSSCEVTVVDLQGNPVPDAKVDFSPNQFCFNGGGQILGNGFDMLSAIRDDIAAGGRRSRPPAWSSENRYSAKTGAQGTALISGLPSGAPGDRTTPIEYMFRVSHDDYATSGELPARDRSKVSIVPGETGQATVRLNPK